MAINIQGFGGVVADVDGTTFRALRATLRPTDHGTLGHYRVSVPILLVATQAANGALFSLRWTDATRFMDIQRIQLKHIQTANHTTALNDIRYQVFVARSFSVSDSIGTAVSLTGNNQKARTSQGTSLVTDMRFSTVAAGLTVGTRTLDARPILQLQTSYLATVATSAPSVVQVEQLLMADNAEHPLILAGTGGGEGIIVQGPTTIFGAAGTATLTVEIAWAEVPAF